MDKTRIHFVCIVLMVFAVNQNPAAQDRITGKPFATRSEVIARKMAWQQVIRKSPRVSSRQSASNSPQVVVFNSAGAKVLSMDPNLSSHTDW